MKHFVQSMFNAVGYELHRSRSADVDYFAALTRHGALAAPTRDDLNARFLRHATAELPGSHAQRLQDLLADFVMEGRSGVFCEFGATDGITYSNSHFLQYKRGWTGLLAEPSQAWHVELAVNRPGAIIDHRCVYARSGESVEFNEVEAGELSGIASLHGDDQFSKARQHGRRYMVETVSLVDLLQGHGITTLDYLSVDTEGSELMIMQEFDFGRFHPSFVTIEHNYTSARQALDRLMLANGYQVVFPEYSAFDGWYILSEKLLSLSTR